MHVHAAEKKTERVTLLTTKSFKSFLNKEARRAGISIGELIRIRCEHKRSPEEEILTSLAVQLRKAAREAQSSLPESIKEANSALAELQAKRSTLAPTHRKRLK